jgi:hypothetical protein
LERFVPWKASLICASMMITRLDRDRRRRNASADPSSVQGLDPPLAFSCGYPG